MRIMALVSPLTFPEVRLGSAADSNMAAAAVAIVHMLARPNIWMIMTNMHMLYMCFTQKLPEIVINTCAKIVKLYSNIFL